MSSYTFDDAKDPSDVDNFKFDFKASTNNNGGTDFLQTGETISTRSITIPSGITLDSSSITDTNTSVTVWLSGGTDGDDYTIVCLITTSTSRTIERSAVVKVRNR